MLGEDEPPLRESSEADEEHVRAGPAGEPGGLGVQENDVLPAGRRRAAQTEMRGEERIDGSPSDDLETELVDVDTPLADFEALAMFLSVGALAVAGIAAP